MFGISRAHLEEVAVLASHVMHLEHLGKPSERLRNLVLGAGLVRADRHEGQHAEPERLRIEQCGVAGDQPARFQLADPLENRRRREAYGSGDIGLCLPGVTLKDRKSTRLNSSHSQISYAV